MKRWAAMLVMVLGCSSSSPPPANSPPATGGKAADGASCVAAADCASGICEGEGCDAGHAGSCKPKDRICTMDVVAYCGCDGKTFTASGSCPGVRYAAHGACK